MAIRSRLGGGRMTSAEDRPGARFNPDGHDIHFYTNEDAADYAAEAYARIREYPGLDDEDATEIATMMYELLTGDWEP